MVDAASKASVCYIPGTELYVPNIIIHILETHISDTSVWEYKQWIDNCNVKLSMLEER